MTDTPEREATRYVVSLVDRNGAHSELHIDAYNWRRAEGFVQFVELAQSTFLPIERVLSITTDKVNAKGDFR